MGVSVQVMQRAAWQCWGSSDVAQPLALWEQGMSLTGTYCQPQGTGNILHYPGILSGFREWQPGYVLVCHILVPQIRRV